MKYLLFLIFCFPLFAQEYISVSVMGGDKTNLDFPVTTDYTAHEIQFVVKGSPGGGRLLQRDNDQVSGGDSSQVYVTATNIRVILDATNTDNWTARNYYYDIEQRGTDTTTIFIGNFTVLQDISSPTDGTYPAFPLYVVALDTPTYSPSFLIGQDADNGWDVVGKGAFTDSLLGIKTLNGYTGTNDSIKLAAALTALGTGASLYFPPGTTYDVGTHTIDLNVMIPKGAILDGNLTFARTSSIMAGEYQIFADSCVAEREYFAHIEWFGDNDSLDTGYNDELRRAVEFLKFGGTLDLTDSIALNKDLHLFIADNTTLQNGSFVSNYPDYDDYTHLKVLSRSYRDQEDDILSSPSVLNHKEGLNLSAVATKGDYYVLVDSASNATAGDIIFITNTESTYGSDGEMNRVYRVNGDTLFLNTLIARTHNADDSIYVFYALKNFTVRNITFHLKGQGIACVYTYFSENTHYDNLILYNDGLTRTANGGSNGYGLRLDYSYAGKMENCESYEHTYGFYTDNSRLVDIIDCKGFDGWHAFEGTNGNWDILYQSCVATNDHYGFKAHSGGSYQYNDCKVINGLGAQFTGHKVIVNNFVVTGEMDATQNRNAWNQTIASITYDAAEFYWDGGIVEVDTFRTILAGGGGVGSSHISEIKNVTFKIGGNSVMRVGWKDSLSNFENNTVILKDNVTTGAAIEFLTDTAAIQIIKGNEFRNFITRSLDLYAYGKTYFINNLLTGRVLNIDNSNYIQNGLVSVNNVSGYPSDFEDYTGNFYFNNNTINVEDTDSVYYVLYGDNCEPASISRNDFYGSDYLRSIVGVADTIEVAAYNYIEGSATMWYASVATIDSLNIND